MNNEWMDIPGYEGYYQVNRNGIVRSLDRQIQKSNNVIQCRKGRIVPIKTNEDGYLKVRLSKDRIRREYFVHTLVGKCFVDGYFDGAEINHKDFDRKNNSSDNLEWVTHKENIAHTVSNGRHFANNDLSGDNNPNFGNRKLSKFYKNNPDASKKNNSRPGKNNGRAKSVMVELPSGEIKKFDYMLECAEFLKSSGFTKSTSLEGISAYISSSAKNNKKYLGCNFYFI